VAAGIGAHTGIATPPLWTFGSAAQHRRWLAPAIRGEKVGALGITEPGAGSDVAGIRTHARRVEGGWMVNGAKTYITNGVRADFVVTAVKTNDAGGHRGLSFLVIEKGMEGFEVSRKLEKLGWHASDTAELSFQDVFVPEGNLLGEENRGFFLIMGNFQWERLLMALGAVGAMQAIVERTRDFLVAASAGTAGSASVESDGPGRRVRHVLAEMALRLESGRALTYRALGLFAGGHDAIREVTMAKLKTQRDCFDVADAALDLHGGSAHIAPAPDADLADLERAARDARLGPIGGGADEVMREILGRQLGL